LTLELWAKECPRTVRNFVQLCVDGFFDDLIFHRIVAGQLVQTGDPTGSGTGAEDIYGGAEDFSTGKEMNARIRFARRGQVAMAVRETPTLSLSRARAICTLYNAS
jgi:peptidyl-prolyl cis-trans isomerase SDCCAG10